MLVMYCCMKGRKEKLMKKIALGKQLAQCNSALKIRNFQMSGGKQRQLFQPVTADPRESNEPIRMQINVVGPKLPFAEMWKDWGRTVMYGAYWDRLGGQNRHIRIARMKPANSCVSPLATFCTSPGMFFSFYPSDNILARDFLNDAVLSAMML